MGDVVVNLVIFACCTLKQLLVDPFRLQYDLFNRNSVCPALTILGYQPNEAALQWIPDTIKFSNKFIKAK